MTIPSVPPPLPPPPPAPCVPSSDLAKPQHIHRDQVTTAPATPPSLLVGQIHTRYLDELPHWAVEDAALILNHQWPRSLAARVQSITVRQSSLEMSFFGGQIFSCFVADSQEFSQRSGRGQDMLPRSIVLLIRSIPNQCSGAEIGNERIPNTSHGSTSNSHQDQYQLPLGGIQGEGIPDNGPDSGSEDRCGAADCPCCTSRRGEPDSDTSKGPCGQCDCYLCHER
jgi:hypothetical protein